MINKDRIFLLVFVLIGSFVFVSSAVNYYVSGDGKGNDLGIIELDYELPLNVINWLSNQDKILFSYLENGHTFIGYNLEDEEFNGIVHKTIDSLDYQHNSLVQKQTYLPHLQGLPMPIECGRDINSSNQLYKIQINNGKIELVALDESQVEKCIW